MIVEGNFTSERRDLNGKPYTFDLDRDFLHMTLEACEVAFSDYFPRKDAPNEYIIIDFDKDGKVVGFAAEGLVAEWARKSFRNRVEVLWMRTLLKARSVALASRILSDLGKQAIVDAFPQLDAQGKLPAYAY